MMVNSVAAFFIYEANHERQASRRSKPGRIVYYFPAPQQFLYFLPLPQVHGSLGATFFFGFVSAAFLAAEDVISVRFMMIPFLAMIKGSEAWTLYTKILHHNLLGNRWFANG